MRMWMVPVTSMCDRHLHGEHVECHMFVGSLRLKKSITGFVANNLVQPLALKIRHDDIVKELTYRNSKYNHKSDLELPDLSYLSDKEKKAIINVKLSQTDLKYRCQMCKLRDNYEIHIQDK